MMKFLKQLLVFTVLLGGLVGVWFWQRSVQIAAAQEQVFTAEELAKYNGKDGNPSYFAYKGKVYDVTASPLWKLGEHYGLQAGMDLTGKMEGAPHGEEVFAAFKIIGVYPDSAVEEKTEATSVPTTTVAAEDAPASTPATKKWYEGRIRILGISLLGWTGIVLGVLFFLTFGTCFAMPWAKLPLPWKGAKPGTDELDDAPRHLTWSSIHKHFVWLTVAFGIIHGVIGFMQMLLGMYL